MYVFTYIGNNARRFSSILKNLKVFRQRNPFHHICCDGPLSLLHFRQDWLTSKSWIQQMSVMVGIRLDVNIVDHDWIDRPLSVPFIICNSQPSVLGYIYIHLFLHPSWTFPIGTFMPIYRDDMNSLSLEWWFN